MFFSRYNCANGTPRSRRWPRHSGWPPFAPNWRGDQRQPSAHFRSSQLHRHESGCHGRGVYRVRPRDHAAPQPPEKFRSGSGLHLKLRLSQGKATRSIIGRNYRDIPGQWEQARKGQESGQHGVGRAPGYAAGGLGLIGRAPVIVPGTNEGSFWGLVSAVIDVDRLFEQAGLDPASKVLRLAIRWKRRQRSGGAVFYGDPELFSPSAGALLNARDPAFRVLANRRHPGAGVVPNRPPSAWRHTW